MPYHTDDRWIDLRALQQRLEDADLIPSQRPLLDGLDAKISALTAAGIKTVEHLHVSLKTAKALSSLAERSGVDTDYLKLLKRTIGGFFPKPRPLGVVDWMEGDTIEHLQSIGIKNTQQLFEASATDVADLAARAGANAVDLRELVTISDLCRIHWVSPSFARVLMAAGAASPSAVAKADPEELFGALVKANAGAKPYKGKVGLRDIGRLVAAAAYVS